MLASMFRHSLFLHKVNTMNVILQPVTAGNWREAMRLNVAPDQQEYVASNLYSIAESRFEPTCVTLAIYAEDSALGDAHSDGQGAVMVGFIMYDTADYYIARFMIDQRYQGRGYGSAAMATLLAQFEQEFAHPQASLSFVPGNEVAERLYERMGFRKTGEMEGDEVVMVRPLQKSI